jgi:hypothetical protein
MFFNVFSYVAYCIDFFVRLLEYLMLEYDIEDVVEVLMPSSVFMKFYLSLQ